MNGNSFCMLVTGVFVISLFGLIIVFGTGWGLVDAGYASVASPSWILVGGLTPNSVTMKLKLPAADAHVLLVSHNRSLLDDPVAQLEDRQEIYFDARVATTLEQQYEIRTVHVRNLRHNTQYYYKVREKALGGGDGTTTTSMMLVDDQLEGRFRTPAPGRFNYTIATAGCANTGSRAQVFYEVEKTNPLLFVHLGDLHYEDIWENNMKARMNAVGRVLASDAQSNLFRSTSLAYMWDDHDFLGNDSDGEEEDEGALDTALQSYQLAFPHYPLPAMDSVPETNDTVPVPVYHAFTIGTVRFVVSDLRSEANQTHIYSDAQRQWLRDELALADRYDFVVWVTPKPWIGPAEEPGEDDAWWGYTQERQELSDYISNTVGADSGPQNLLAISADAHMVAFDDGTNTYYGENPKPGTITRSFPILQSGSLDKFGKTKGDAFSDGCHGFSFQRTHQFSTLSFQFTTNESHTVEKCIQIDAYRNIEFSRVERELLLSKRLCGKIFKTTPAPKDQKEGTCEIDFLWEANTNILVAATVVCFLAMVTAISALRLSDATNLGDCCCKSCLVSSMVAVSYILTLAVGFGTQYARGVNPDVTPVLIVLLCQTFCWLFYAGTWWAFCTTSSKLRVKPRDPNDPAFLDVEPNYFIQDGDLEIMTTREDDKADLLDKLGLDDDAKKPNNAADDAKAREEPEMPPPKKAPADASLDAESEEEE